MSRTISKTGLWEGGIEKVREQHVTVLNIAVSLFLYSKPMSLLQSVKAKYNRSQDPAVTAPPDFFRNPQSSLYSQGGDNSPFLIFFFIFPRTHTVIADARNKSAAEALPGLPTPGAAAGAAVAGSVSLPEADAEFAFLF